MEEEGEFLLITGPRLPEGVQTCSLGNLGGLTTSSFLHIFLFCAERGSGNVKHPTQVHIFFN